MNIGDIIKIGKTAYGGYKTSKDTIDYEKTRISQLQKLLDNSNLRLYDNQTIQKMIYFELGAKELAGTGLKAGMAGQCEQIGGAGGAVLWTPFDEATFGGGTVVGKIIGGFFGKATCDTGVDKVVTPFIIQPAIKHYSEQLFKNNPNPENQDVSKDLAKLKSQINNSFDFIQPTDQYWPAYKSNNNQGQPTGKIRDNIQNQSTGNPISNNKPLFDNSNQKIMFSNNPPPSRTGNAPMNPQTYGYVASYKHKLYPGDPLYDNRFRSPNPPNEIDLLRKQLNPNYGDDSLYAIQSEIYMLKVA